MYLQQNIFVMSRKVDWCMSLSHIHAMTHNVNTMCAPLPTYQLHMCRVIVWALQAQSVQRVKTAHYLSWQLVPQLRRTLALRPEKWPSIFNPNNFFRSYLRTSEINHFYFHFDKCSLLFSFIAAMNCQSRSTLFWKLQVKINISDTLT